MKCAWPLIALTGVGCGYRTLAGGPGVRVPVPQVTAGADPRLAPLLQRALKRQLSRHGYRVGERAAPRLHLHLVALETDVLALRGGRLGARGLVFRLEASLRDSPSGKVRWRSGQVKVFVREPVRLDSIADPRRASRLRGHALAEAARQIAATVISRLPLGGF